ncbi:hypothetical protein ACT1UG_00500 [Bacillus paramycoides]|uniref:hypothetical protein n=1 Tax=Bacillus paramycoides TaxID=2026194 RepID=UPI0040595476
MKKEVAFYTFKFALGKKNSLNAKKHLQMRIPYAIIQNNYKINSFTQCSYLKAAIHMDGSFRRFIGGSILILFLNKQLEGASNNERRSKNLTIKKEGIYSLLGARISKAL